MPVPACSLGFTRVIADFATVPPATLARLGGFCSLLAGITRGQFRGVSEAKLLELVAKLGHDVKIVVDPVRRRAGKIELQFA